MADLKVNQEMKDAIVGMLQDLPNVTAVCKLFGVNPWTISKHRKKDKAFDEAVNQAINEGYDMLEEEARRRAVDGVVEPVYFKGEVVGGVRKYSDALLQTLLKAYRPKKFNPGAKLSLEDSGQKITMTFNIGGDDDE